ncbi:hypothetical protein, partial [Stenotrophomonas sp. SrG]|uniref:hypothetical protein n=1 Tax=Stenotrophomonas sp. SrG TaxID=3414430 RepID=UPI003CF2E88D
TLWAFRQTDHLTYARRFEHRRIDNRQLAHGAYAGGISDATDLPPQGPGLAQTGVEPARLTRSLTALSAAVYRNGMYSPG